MSNIAFYVSGHGFGHARRAAQLIRALVDADRSVQVLVRTTAAAHLFAGIERTAVHAPMLSIDPGMAERDPLTLDVPATLARIVDLFAQVPQARAAELAFLRQHPVSLLLCDIPWFPGEIARAAGLPCLAIGNFTWDWIYHPLLAHEPAYAGVEEQIQSLYGQMSLMLRLPFSHPAPFFRQLIDVPLIAQPCPRPPDEVLARLGLDASDPRPRILLGLRGGLPDATLRTAIAANRDFRFLSLQPFPGSAPAHFSHVRPETISDFSDLLCASHAVVSKLGYGIVADCIANRTPILWPRRGGFREEQIFISQGPQFMRMQEISLDDFHAGRWSPALHSLLALPAPPRAMPTNGAQVCALLALKAMDGTLASGPPAA